MVKPHLKLYTLLLKAQDAEMVFHVSYEVAAAHEEDAARFAIADLVRRGEEALDVEHVEMAEIANPFAQAGVRLRTGRERLS